MRAGLGEEWGFLACARGGEQGFQPNSDYVRRTIFNKTGNIYYGSRVLLSDNILRFEM